MSEFLGILSSTRHSHKLLSINYQQQWKTALKVHLNSFQIVRHSERKKRDRKKSLNDTTDSFNFKYKSEPHTNTNHFCFRALECINISPGC